MQCLLRMRIQAFNHMVESCSGEGSLGEEEPSTLTSSIKEGLSSSSRSQVKVLKSFLYAAVPSAKVEHFRELMKENSFRLTDRQHIVISFLYSTLNCRPILRKS